MNSFFNIIKELLKSFSNCIRNNLYNICIFIIFVLPYLMLFIGEYVYKFRNGFYLGLEMFIPIVVFIIVIFIIKYNKNKKTEGMPIPEKRFTQVDEDEVVSIKRGSLVSMMLYVSELEDYLEKQGKL